MKSKTASSESKGDFVSVDPYDRMSLWMHIKYSTLWTTWPQMLFFTSVAIAVVVADRLKAGLNLGIAPTMLTVLGTVLGFCISYRTSSAYERYIEGRKLWQQVQVATRTASRLIWFHCPNETNPNIEQHLKSADAARALLEKKTMLNLLEAFAVALKHYLRGETGIHYADLYHLVLFLPKYQLPNTTPIRRADIPQPTPQDSLSRSNSSSNVLDDSIDIIDDKAAITSDGVRFRQNTVSSSPSSVAGGKKVGPRNPDKPLLPAHNPPPFNLIDDVLPFLAPIRSIFKFGRKHITELLDHEAAERRKMKRKHKKEIYAGSNIPMELNLHMSNWIGALQRRKTIDAGMVGQLLAANGALADTLSGLERVLTTPLPFSYAIHLKHVSYVYIILLPFQLLPTLGYLTIPAVFVSAYVFLGFLQIGDWIEQPLGYDAADLDMGGFVSGIRKELREVAAMPVQDPADFFFTAWNEPLAPSDVRSAEELVQAGVEIEEIEDALAKDHSCHTGVERSYTDWKAEEKEDDRNVMSYLPKVKREGDMV